MNVLLAFLLILPAVGQLWSQQPGDPPERKRKPVLIRVDRSQAEVEAEVIQPDPAKAAKDVEVGDFYFKQKNYKAAEERYREAILYHPTWPEPYQKLIRTLEKTKEYRQALEICRQFLATNPDSQESEEFEEKIRQLEKKIDKAQKG